MSFQVFFVKYDHEPVACCLIDLPVTFPNVIEELGKVLLHQKIHLFIIQGFTHAGIPANVQEENRGIRLHLLKPQAVRIYL